MAHERIGFVGLGLMGQFIAVALGITAYGLICALAVRPGVWPGRV